MHFFITNRVCYKECASSYLCYCSATATLSGGATIAGGLSQASATVATVASAVQTVDSTSWTACWHWHLSLFLWVTRFTESPWAIRSIKKQGRLGLLKTEGSSVHSKTIMANVVLVIPRNYSSHQSLWLNLYQGCYICQHEHAIEEDSESVSDLLPLVWMRLSLAWEVTCSLFSLKSLAYFKKLWLGSVSNRVYGEFNKPQQRRGSPVPYLEIQRHLQLLRGVLHVIPVLLLQYAMRFCYA